MKKQKGLNYGGVFYEINIYAATGSDVKVQERRMTYEQIVKEYVIKLSSLQEIVSKYESLEKGGLKDTHKNMKYNDDLKTQAVEDYLLGKGSLIEICRKYKIRSKMALRDRIKWYNGHMGSSKTKGQLC